MSVVATAPLGLVAPLASLTPLASVVTSLTAAVEPWKRFYDDSTIAQTAVVFAHLGALLIGGGLALTLDRGTLRAVRGGSTDRARQLDALGEAHGTVVGALLVAAVTGAALFLADVETFATSPVYWTKMALVALLLANGRAMTLQERRVRAHGGSADAAQWRGLRVTAITSAVLWLATLLAGVALTNAA